MTQNLSKCQYRVQARGDTNLFTGEREQTLSSQSPGSNSWWEPNEVCAESGELEGAGAVHGEIKAEKNVSDLCTWIAECALRLARTGEKEHFKKMMRVISVSSFDPGELRRYVKRGKNCQLILMKRGEDEMAKEDFGKENFRRESTSSTSGSTPYKNNILTVLQEQMFSSHLGSFCFSSGDFALEVTHSVSTKHDQMIEKTVRERVMGPAVMRFCKT